MTFIPLGGGGGTSVITPSNILTGYQTVSASGTSGPTTVITIPAGETWQGVCQASVTASGPAANTTQAQAVVVFASAGTGVVPPAGPICAVAVQCGANAATGTVGVGGSNNISPLVTVAAPAGNSVTITITTTIAAGSTAGRVDASCVGTLL